MDNPNGSTASVDEAQAALDDLLKAAVAGEDPGPSDESEASEGAEIDGGLQPAADPPAYDREALITATLEKIATDGDPFRDRLLAEAYATSFELQVLMYDVKRFMAQADAFMSSGGGGIIGKMLGLGKKG